MGEHAWDADNPDQRRLYGDLAWLWPIVSPLEDYVEEADEFRDLIRKYARIKVQRVLHLGCGGGHLDHHLKKHFQLTGVDLSAPFLKLARALNPEVTYLQGDMRSARLGEQFEAVIIADSIDYMLTLEDLVAAFRSAYTHLRPGGVLCTYAEETRERFQQNKTRTSTHRQGEREVVSIENFYDPDPADTTYEMTFVYLIRRRGQLQVETDRHLAGLFTVGEWIGALEEVGFQVAVEEYQAAGPSFVGLKPG